MKKLFHETQLLAHLKMPLLDSGNWVFIEDFVEPYWNMDDTRNQPTLFSLMFRLSRNTLSQQVLAYALSFFVMIFFLSSIFGSAMRRRVQTTWYFVDQLELFTSSFYYLYLSLVVDSKHG